MRKLFLLLLLIISTSVSAGGLKSLLNDVVRAATQDIEQEGGSQHPENKEVPRAEKVIEIEIVTCDIHSMGVNFNSCEQTRFEQCFRFLNALPIDADGEEQFKKVFEYPGKCHNASSSINVPISARARYDDAIKSRRSKICIWWLDAATTIKDAELLIGCYDVPGFKEKRNEKVAQLAKAEEEKKKVAKELKAKENGGLIDKYKKVVSAPPQLLLADIVVQWGSSNFGPLIEFIDLAQNDPRSKAKYEMAGNELVMRLRISDPVTRESTTVIYVFSPHPQLPPGEIFLSRMVIEESAMGGLAKKHNEVDAKEIGLAFTLVYSGLVERSKK